MKFIMDTQCYIHYNLFTDCDWRGLLGSDELTLVVVPTVLGEIEDKKFDQRGHIKQRAREISSKFREIIKGKPLPNGITVEFMSLPDKIDYNSNGLKEYNSDDKIISETLILINQEPKEEIYLVTADLGVELKAKTRGINIISPPEEWIRETKDPRDKKIKELEDYIKKTYPELKLSFINDEEEYIEDCIGSLEILVSPLTNQYIENKLSEIESNNQAKLSKLIKTNARQILGSIPENEIKEYEVELNDYIKNYKKYFLKLNRVNEELSQIFEVPFLLINTGGQPAEDIDLRIKLPSDIELLEEIPEIPKEPEEPKPPSTLFERMAGYQDYGRLAFNVSDLLKPPVLINEEDRESGPEIDFINNEARYWKRRLKHDFVKEIRLYAKFKYNQNPHTFTIDYYINAANHPKPTRGKLTFIIKPQPAS